MLELTDCEKVILKLIYGKYCKIVSIGKIEIGKNYRKYFWITYSGGYSRTISYAKFYIESVIGKKLIGECVHHRNYKAWIDNPFNYKVLTGKAHNKLHGKYHNNRKYDHGEGKCINCHKKFRIPRKHVYNYIQSEKRGSVGPFCSQSCSRSFLNKMRSVFGWRKSFIRIPIRIFYYKKVA